MRYCISDPDSGAIYAFNYKKAEFSWSQNIASDSISFKTKSGDFVNNAEQFIKIKYFSKNGSFDNRLKSMSTTGHQTKIVLLITLVTCQL